MSADEKTKIEIEALRELEEKAFGPRHGKTDCYEYLDGVWKLYGAWKQCRWVRKRTGRVVRLYEVKLRKNTHPIRAIIDASSKQKADVKSEWTRALRYALTKKSEVENVGLNTFLVSNGGIAGCASQGAKNSAA
jgi:hypothetical protein